MQHRSSKVIYWALVAALGLFGCGGGSGSPDAAPDASLDATADAGPAEVIEDLPVAEESQLPGLSAAVEAVQDTRGMWHVYAANLEDAMRAQGLLQARDRMAQMEFVRRSATGRTAEFAGSFVPSLQGNDADARFEGHLRNARAILPTLSAEERNLLEAYAAGVNHHIEALRNDEAFLPPGIGEVLPADIIDDWTPIDTLSIARLQAAALSFSASSDIAMSKGLADWETNFAADATDPRIARLAGAFHDLFDFSPSHAVWVRDGFPNVGSDSGTRALRPPTVAPGLERMSSPLPSTLRGAAARLERIEARFQHLFGDDTRGSNSWVVSGEHTASGNPILANDPHLALTSPPLFWQAHVDTARLGGEDLQVAGQMIVGTPAMILGFNQHLAWGLTTHGYDVTDTYLERITPGVGGAPDTVEFNGAQVPIETITEVILDDLNVEHEVTFERVPHHGLILPESRSETEAISIRWTGNTPSNEAGAFIELYRASSVAEAEAAIEKFEVGGQCFVVATTSGDIFYSSQVRLPVRDAAAMTYDPSTRLGEGPSFVLPGHTGDHEWTGDLSDRFIPHELNPTRGYIATANGDSVGVTEDGNPFNDEHYIGGIFAPGYRIGRITERLEEMVSAGGITPEDMSALQGDAQSPLGRAYSAEIVAALTRAEAEAATPGTHDDLTAIVTEAGARMARLVELRDRLTAWTSFDTPAAVEGTPSADEIADSVATTFFNVAFSHIARNLVYDEGDWLDNGAFDDERRVTGLYGRAIHRAFTDPESMRSFEASYPRVPGEGVMGDTVLWDDISTDEVETRGEVIVRGALAALDWLLETMGDDMDQWRWGTLHTLRLRAIVPAESVTGVDRLSIPTATDEEFPNGYPRHGDRGVVDASNFGYFNTEAFAYGSGPQQRLVVEMTPEGPRAWNSMPGGNAEDPASPHQRDQMQDWRHNRVQAVPFLEADVVAAAERRIRFVP